MKENAMGVCTSSIANNYQQLQIKVEVSSNLPQIDNLYWIVFHLNVSFVRVLEIRISLMRSDNRSSRNETHCIYRHIWMRVKCLFRCTLQNGLEAWRVSQTEDSKAVNCVSSRAAYVMSQMYLGVDFGAQTTANDSGNILWNPECV